jgi:hypothetical protein
MPTGRRTAMQRTLWFSRGIMSWVALLSLLALSPLAQAWQAAGTPAGYPTTQPMRSAGAPYSYPNTSTSNYPQTPLYDSMVRGGLPSAPAQPRAVMQPQNWPGAVASDLGPGAPPSAYPTSPAAGAGQYPRTNVPQTTPSMQASAELLQPRESLVIASDVQILATVASDPILASDVLPYVDDVFNANKNQIPPDQQDMVRTQLIRQRLKSLIETKSVVNHARNKVPKDNLKTVEKKINDIFEKHEVPRLMKKGSCETRVELAEKLKETGTSIERERQAFFEKTLAAQWLQEQVRSDVNKEITHDEMLAWYRDHAAEYEVPAKVRWQQLTVRAEKTRYANTAQQKIIDLGNMIAVQGIPFSEVAKKHSDGTTAASGGYRDWTNQGSLVSKKLDEALFTLEVGKLSPIIEDEQGLHIILVLERQDPGKVPFLEAQVGIKEKIKKERQQESIKDFLVELKETTPVWTIYDVPLNAEAPRNNQR